MDNVDNVTRKKFSGVVISDSMDKSRVVETYRKKRHPLYGKFIKIRKKYMIHDENNVSHIGDTVQFEECPPFSARKRWKLTKVIQESEE